MMQLRHPYSKIVFSKLLKENNLQKHLALLRCHHPDTYRHSCRVGLLCIDISLDLNLTAAELMLLGYAGLLHDLGKSRIPHQVLAKKSSLDRHEKEMMREHPRLGFLALLDSD
jgi:HD-GYP domain-containing protein (c-di-GMP phosphodiesterase class II)